MSTGDTANIAYLLAAMLLFGMAAAGASRRAKAVGAKGPGAMTSLLIWLAIIALVAALYFGAEIWRGAFAIVR
jgi:LPXTG-motif cell wall-anchored protein